MKKAIRRVMYVEKNTKKTAKIRTRRLNVRPWQQNRFIRAEDEVVTCPVCIYEIATCNQAQHEKSQTHQYFLQKLLDPDFETEVPKPDKIGERNGKQHYCLPFLLVTSNVVKTC